jgi:hypothetical protein
MTAEQQLAQLAVTGTLNHTFYAEAQHQLEDMLAAAQMVEPEFLAKTAIYARQRGFMKDAPALLLAWLSMLQTPHFGLAFDRVVDNGKMLRTFVQIMRSGATGRKSLGTRPKRMIRHWLQCFVITLPSRLFSRAGRKMAGGNTLGTTLGLNGGRTSRPRQCGESRWVSRLPCPPGRLE